MISPPPPMQSFVRMAATALIIAAALPAAMAVAHAEEAAPIEVTLKDQTFTPAKIKVAVGTAVVVKLENLNAGPAEIESKPLKIEKVVKAEGEIVVNVKAKIAGKFLFVDEYHEDIAKGFFIAQEELVPCWRR
jgi:plastocyanin